MRLMKPGNALFEWERREGVSEIQLIAYVNKQLEERYLPPIARDTEWFEIELQCNQKFVKEVTLNEVVWHLRRNGWIARWDARIADDKLVILVKEPNE